MSKTNITVEINFELRQLNRTADMAQQLYREAGDDPQPWHAAAAAKYISDFMLGLENLWKRRCRHLRAPIPAGPSFHRQILA